jgi:hypothetical protein
MSAPKGPKPGEDASRERRVAQAPREQVMLDRRYGAIGISAVAAAVRYAGATKNPAYAHSPSTARLAARLDELSVA